MKKQVPWGHPCGSNQKKTLGYHFSCIFRKSQDIIFHAFLGRVNEYGTHSQVHNIYQTNPSSFIKNLSRHFMSQHCQPISNHHREQPQERNNKINSKCQGSCLESNLCIHYIHPWSMGAHETWNGLNLHWNKVNHILTLDTDILTRQTVEMLLHLKKQGNYNESSFVGSKSYNNFCDGE